MIRAALIALALTVAACASPPRTMQDFAPLSAAFVEPIESLQARASTGDAQAQYAMSVLARHGLRGVPQSEQAADLYFLGATMQRGTNMTPVYVTGVNGAPGSTIFVATPIYGMDPPRAQAFEICVAALAVGVGGAACGDPAVADALEAQFNAARAASTPLP